MKALTMFECNAVRWSSELSWIVSYQTPEKKQTLMCHWQALLEGGIGPSLLPFVDKSLPPASLLKLKSVTGDLRRWFLSPPLVPCRPISTPLDFFCWFWFSSSQRLLLHPISFIGRRRRVQSCHGNNKLAAGYVLFPFHWKRMMDIHLNLIIFTSRKTNIANELSY